MADQALLQRAISIKMMWDSAHHGPNGDRLPLMWLAVGQMIRLLVDMNTPTLTAESLTASPPTTESPTREALSAAAAPASTDQQMSASSRSDPLTTHASLVVSDSPCVHNFARLGEMRTPQHPELRMLECCMNCGALVWSARTPAPVATPASSTSQSPASPSSAEPLSEASAPSASAVLTEVADSIERLTGFPIISENDRGYAMGISTAAQLVKMRARRAERDAAADEVTR